MVGFIKEKPFRCIESMYLVKVAGSLFCLSTFCNQPWSIESKAFLKSIAIKEVSMFVLCAY